MPAWEKAETFEDYLEAKKINAAAWQAIDSEQYASQKQLFEQLGPNNFDQRAKFLIMDWRLRFPGLVSDDTKKVHARDW